MSAIRRADLTEKIMCNDRICSRHFLSEQPACLQDENNPDWLPTLNLGHSKQISKYRERAAEERWERARARESNFLVRESTNIAEQFVVTGMAHNGPQHLLLMDKTGND